MHACIIDPSKSARDVLGGKLTSLGIEVTSYNNGSSALENILPEETDIVLVALVLEDMGGPEFCQIFRTRGGEGVPVIMITSSERDHIQIDAMKSGITEIFQKSNHQLINDYLQHFVEQKRLSHRVAGTVLYVEDSRSVARIIKAQLESFGLTVDHFFEAYPALEAFTENEYDLVLIDVVLGGEMSGIGLARAIRSFEGKRHRIPILAMSSIDDTSRKVELLRSGVNDYVAKPVVKEELAARVRNLIENKKLVDKVQEQRMRLESMATSDQLTGLHNRRYLQEAVGGLMSDARRNNIAMSIVMVDLDFFKKVNDSHGHTAGDKVLVDTAKLLKESCRQEDFAVRFGGEEFVLILPHCKLEDAVRRAESLRAKISQSKLAGLNITASFGVAELDVKSDSTFEELFNRADGALYQAKKSGRNRVEFVAIACD